MNILFSINLRFHYIVSILNFSLYHNYDATKYEVLDNDFKVISIAIIDTSEVIIIINKLIIAQYADYR